MTDDRGWGDLVEGTPLEWPVPYSELDARTLDVAERTVKAHVSALYRKLGYREAAMGREESLIAQGMTLAISELTGELQVRAADVADRVETVGGAPVVEDPEPDAVGLPGGAGVAGEEPRGVEPRVVVRGDGEGRSVLHGRASEDCRLVRLGPRSVLQHRRGPLPLSLSRRYVMTWSYDKQTGQTVWLAQ